jgi:hypothetical protein
MPHFCSKSDNCKDNAKCSGETVVCQVCGRVTCCLNVLWMTPVPGKAFNGNVCKQCAPKIGPRFSEYERN